MVLVVVCFLDFFVGFLLDFFQMVEQCVLYGLDGVVGLQVVYVCEVQCGYYFVEYVELELVCGVVVDVYWQ